MVMLAPFLSDDIGKKRFSTSANYQFGISEASTLSTGGIGGGAVGGVGGGGGGGGEAAAWITGVTAEAAGPVVPPSLVAHSCTRMVLPTSREVSV